MPEGDTIFKAARALEQALKGQPVTSVQTRVEQIRRLGPQRLVGQTVSGVEPRGKHMLIWFEPSGLALHSHMRMSGSWHLYREGEPWRKGEHLARFSLTVPGWQAVCFSAPICQLLSRAQVERHPQLSSLGPDVLAERPDLAEARVRLRARADWTIAEALLDQRVLAGVGNVFKSEVLFVHGIDPWTTVAELSDSVLDAVLATCERMLKENVRPGAVGRTTTPEGASYGRLFVYGHARLPCPRCATPIRRALQGAQARSTYWCPRCQGPGPARSGNAKRPGLAAGASDGA